jgi:O-antigen ligase
LRWHGSSGDLLLDRFAHDEYLQILWKSGLVGLAVFLAALTCGANLVRRGRHSVGNRELWAGAVAGLAALAVSSSLDFLWHLAVIPLVGAVLAGVAIPRIEEQG